jgi:5-aminopentanamidase
VTATSPSPLPPSDLRVAAVQMQCAPADVKANLAEHLRLAQGAVAAGAALVVFPELSVTGYELGSIAADDRLTLTPDDPRLDRLHALAVDTGTTLVLGAPVRVPSGLALAALALRPTGGETVVYAKTHLHGDERALFAPGSGPLLVDVHGWGVALGVCFDAAVPEHAAAARDLGATLYAVGGLYTTGQEGRIDDQLAGRARENRVHTLLAQHAGTAGPFTACGGSGVWAPDGTSVVQLGAGHPDLAVATLAAPTVP